MLVLGRPSLAGGLGLDDCPQANYARFMIYRSPSWWASLPGPTGALSPIKVGDCYQWAGQLDLRADPRRIAAVSLRFADCYRSGRHESGPYYLADSATVDGWESMEHCANASHGAPAASRRFWFATGTTPRSNTLVALMQYAGEEEPSSFRRLSKTLGASSRPGPGFNPDGYFAVADWCDDKGGGGSPADGSTVGRVSDLFGSGPAVQRGRQFLGSGLCRQGAVSNLTCPGGSADSTCWNVSSSVFECADGEGAASRTYQALLSPPGFRAPSHPLPPSSVLSNQSLSSLGCPAGASSRNTSAVIALSWSTMSPSVFDAESYLNIGSVANSPSPRPRPSTGGSSGSSDDDDPILLNLFLGGLSAFGLLVLCLNARLQCFLYPMSRLPGADIRSEPSAIGVREVVTRHTESEVNQYGFQVSSRSWLSTSYRLVVGAQEFPWDSRTCDDARVLHLPGGGRAPMAYVDRVWQVGAQRLAVTAIGLVGLIVIIVAIAEGNMAAAPILVSVAMVLVFCMPWHELCASVMRGRAARAQAAKESGSTINPLNNV